MKDLFLQFAPYITLIFIIALPPEVIRNFKSKTYSSGTLMSWGMRIVGYIIFGIYSVMIKENVVAVTQFVALTLSICILLQRFTYKHAM